MVEGVKYIELLRVEGKFCEHAASVCVGGGGSAYSVDIVVYVSIKNISVDLETLLCTYKGNSLETM